ncbi:putative ATPase [Rhodospirillaceae bacterium LM-1]|nr:putative ATPase [Rhodospirillaceae bacterium LM-1]
MSDKTSDAAIFLGASDKPVHLNLRYANRHGLIAGATGTGKTVTLQVMVEEFSKAGVPVLIADVKGDLSGLCVPGDAGGKLGKRAEQIGLKGYAPQGFPVVFWDVFAKNGHPLRSTISDLGPVLLARLMGLNETQEGVLNAAFALADDEGLLLLDLDDLRALLRFLEDNRDQLSSRYGNIAPATVGAIVRQIMVFEREGGAHFFGEPALGVAELLQSDRYGMGLVHIVDAQALIHKPQLYATVMLWLLSELFEELPEVGDPQKPLFALFLDEAHLLFDGAPKPLLDKVEQVARLIRSKGVGVYFVTQNPLDIPVDVAGQLGNRVQHALRAFTVRDQKAVRAAAETFRANPAFDAEAAITELGVGEALVSVLQEGGVPSVVERTLLRPPSSRLGPASDAERAGAQKYSPYAGRYDKLVNRESAHELLAKLGLETAEAAERAMQAAKQEKEDRQLRKTSGGSNRQGIGEALAKSVVRSVGSRIGREIVRGVLGSLFKGR